MPGRKSAVILTHGMGEQMPMATLRGFAEAVWVHNPDIDGRRRDDPPKGGNPVWWKPDTRNASYELYRITTRSGGHHEGSDAPRVDFFEFYWADLTTSTTTAQLRDWFMSLLLRRPGRVPSDVRGIWLALWIATIGVIGLLSLQGLAQILDWKLDSWVKGLLWVFTALSAIFIGFAVAYFGDVAHYIRAKPANIQARREIRKRGLELLQTLSRSGEYDRIILVGHSLGSVIAYDLVRLLWAEEYAARTFAPAGRVADALAAVRKAGEDLNAKPSDAGLLDAYQIAQKGLFAGLREAHSDPRKRWLISDLVTLGCPLTHAEFLIARDLEALKQDVEARRLPSAPPATEASGDYAYPVPDPTAAAMRLHHAAPFSLVRWTNIYDPGKLALFGDIISGPVRGNFGTGVRDVAVRISGRVPLIGRIFTHTRYWDEDKGAAQSLVALRQALKLDER
ncbi:hypothetical protein AB4037_05765 [Labrys sp. KB_33_2]|uniref:hypothetical protein n=1 Tax=unclassified Labrys (in: a-proteobacteria) TaxID=2688601 RepID=UPI003EBF2C97